MAIMQIEYMCSYCGKKEVRNTKMGRPKPGTCSKQGKKIPHTWVVNRVLN